MKAVVTIGVSSLAGLCLTILLDAPVWAGCIGGWAFWAAVRPKEWL